MVNNFENLKNSIRSIAKRCKSVSYSTALVVSFAMLGASAFSQENILTGKEINDKATNLEETLKNVRAKNNKKLKGARLELIQLMEQGDQVVKSPWSSWQFGLNYLFDSYNGSYKGRNDKDLKYPYEGIFTRSNDKITRSVAENSSQYSKLKFNSIFGSALSSDRKGLDKNYGIDLKRNAEEPIVGFEVNVAVTPRVFGDNKVNVDLPKIEVAKGNIPAIQLDVRESLKLPEIKEVKVPLDLPQPNTKPYTNFSFIDPYRRDTYIQYGNAEYVEETYDKILGGEKVPVDPANPDGPKKIQYDEKVNITDIHGKPFTPKPDWIAIHTVWNGRVKDTHIILNNKAAAFSLETWHAPKIAFKDSSVTIKGDDNTVFYLYPAQQWKILREDGDYHAFSQRGAFIGELDIDISSQRNAIFSMLGSSGTYNISPEGKFKLEGANNLIFSGLGYSPDYQQIINNKGKNGINFIGKIYDRYKTGMTPIINLKQHPEIYGDGNVAYYFSDLLPDGTSDYPSTNVYRTTDNREWRPTKIGIYQGEVNAKAIVGNKLAIADGAQTQIKKRIPVEPITPNPEDQQYRDEEQGNNKYVEGVAVLFAQSGQRAGIVPTRDLGMQTCPWADLDEIHPLYVNDVNMIFGKYSLKTLGIVADRGTQIDVAMPTNTHTENKGGVALRGKPITDYREDTTVTSSHDDSVNQAATGTIFAYAKGKWSDSVTRTTGGGDAEGYKPMSTDTINALKDAKSEINFGVGVITSARYKNIDGVDYYPVTYVAEGGIINAKDTEAKGYGSIIGSAKDAGKVNIEGKVTAKDEWVAADSETDPYLKTNIGGYAIGDKSIVKISGKSEIYGSGAHAIDKGKVELSAADNEITVGKGVVGLFAKNGGEIDFAGGKIIVGDGASKDSLPFYAIKEEGKDTPKIKFTGPTEINMTNGFIPIEDSFIPVEAKGNYAENSEASAKYEGMKNVTLDLSNQAELAKIRDGENISWNGIPDLPELLRTSMGIEEGKFRIDDPRKNISLYYVNGSIAINTDVSLDVAKDGFNSIKMERELVTINGGKTVSSAEGRTLTVSSNAGASSNTKTGYINKGIVDISGGTTNKTAALAVNYGIVKNEGQIKVDTGTGIFGTNGSKLENEGLIKISGKGYGIVASASRDAASPTNFGKDANASVNAIDITNTGDIEIAGNDSIAIYAYNNTNAPQSEVVVNNNKKIEIKEKSIGIAVKGQNGGEINVTGNGNLDIVAGKGSIGIQGENTKVTLNNDYIIETKENGVGIYLTGNSIVASTNSNDIFKYRYSGAADAQGTAISINTATGENGVNDVNIVLDNSTNGKLIGIYASGAGTFTNNGSITGTSTANEIGIAGENTSIINKGNIKLATASNITKPNIGIFAKGGTVTNISTNGSSIEIGDDSVGIYGQHADIINSGTIKAGNKSAGIYSLGGNVEVTGTIEVGNNESAGIYVMGESSNIELKRGASMVIGKNSFGVVDKGKGNTITAETADAKLATDSVFMFSADKTGTIENKGKITNIGSDGGNYGIYSVGTSKNSGIIDLANGIGNVAMYSTDGGKAINTGNGKIVVGETNIYESKFSIGMAAGVNGENGARPATGIVENNGVIEVKGKNSVGMFATQAGSTATNTGTIVLDADSTIGIYAEEGAVVKNTGTIKTGTGNYKRVTGVYLQKGAVLDNEGTINIVSTGGQGVYLQGGIVKNYGTITVGGTAKKIHTGTGATSKTVGAVTIEAPAGASEAVIKVQTPEGIVIAEPEIVTAKEVHPGTVSANSIGMYVDTSGIRFTNPIGNLGTLTEEADLIVGTEATLGTNSKDIVVENSRILKPYNESMLNNPEVSKWNVYSAGLTWMSTATLDKKNGTLKKLYMSKIEYTEFAGDDNTYNFLDGLEQRYGMNSLGSKEKQVFNKLNGIGKNEEILFNQAVDEMMGHQYANVQQRIHETGRVLDKEFRYLKDEWRTMSKDSNKVKVFGMRGEYSTETAGIIDYKSDAYGVAYLGENETLRLGDTSGWYAGLVENRFKFKDYGKSKEKQLQGKFGVFKSVPFDENNSLNWTVSGEGFVGYNKMDRKYLVVDEIFGAKSNYWSYGVALRNELSKDFRMTESTNFKVYGAVKAEYGRYSDIKEKSGEVKLEVKANDYLSIKPEIGGELGYKHLLNDKYFFNTKLNVAYENEVGELSDVDNKARVKDTTADWYKLRSEKEDRRGNVRTDLSIGVDNEQYGVTANIGYDTKGKNRRVGLGLRVIF